MLARPRSPSKARRPRRAPYFALSRLPRLERPARDSCIPAAPRNPARRQFTPGAVCRSLAFLLGLYLSYKRELCRGGFDPRAQHPVVRGTTPALASTLKVKRAVEVNAFNTFTAPAGSSRPSRPCSGRACKSASSAQRNALTVLGSCAGRSRLPAGAWRTSGAACGSRPAW